MKQLLVFVLFAALFCWLMFSPIYKHVLVIRHALLQQEADYLLEVGASGQFGYIDGAMLAQSRARLAEHGFEAAKVEYDVTTTTGLAANDALSPVPRGVGIRLSIRYPYDNLMQIDRLIGIQPPGEEARIAAGGLKMSEYVP
jgi:hypothetical protein